jgi:hypothetical protein
LARTAFSSKISNPIWRQISVRAAPRQPNECRQTGQRELRGKQISALDISFNEQ